MYSNQQSLTWWFWTVTVHLLCVVSIELRFISLVQPYGSIQFPSICHSIPSPIQLHLSPVKKYKNYSYAFLLQWEAVSMGKPSEGFKLLYRHLFPQLNHNETMQPNFYTALANSKLVWWYNVQRVHKQYTSDSTLAHQLSTYRLKVGIIHVQTSNGLSSRTKNLAVAILWDDTHARMHTRTQKHETRCAWVVHVQ